MCINWCSYILTKCSKVQVRQANFRVAPLPGFRWIIVNVFVASILNCHHHLISFICHLKDFVYVFCWMCGRGQVYQPRESAVTGVWTDVRQPSILEKLLELAAKLLHSWESKGRYHKCIDLGEVKLVGVTSSFPEKYNIIFPAVIKVFKNWKNGIKTAKNWAFLKNYVPGCRNCHNSKNLRDKEDIGV